MWLNVLFALLGLLVGSLINVLADDLPARESPARPHCPQCDHVYAPGRWLALARRLRGGHCPHCDFPVRRRALLVEIVTPLLFALLPSLLDEGPNLIFGALYVAILILVIVVDLEHRLILHAVTVPGTLLALAGSPFIDNNSLLLALLGAIFGFVVFFAFYWLGRRLFGPGALGFGDVMLSAMMGAMVGFPYIVFALVIGILLGGAISLLLILVRRLSMQSYLAYGPFLAVAGIITVVWGEQILAWYLG